MQFLKIHKYGLYVNKYVISYILSDFDIRTHLIQIHNGFNQRCSLINLYRSINMYINSKDSCTVTSKENYYLTSQIVQATHCGSKSRESLIMFLRTLKYKFFFNFKCISFLSVPISAKNVLEFWFWYAVSVSFTIAHSLHYVSSKLFN